MGGIGVAGLCVAYVTTVGMDWKPGPTLLGVGLIMALTSSEMPVGVTTAIVVLTSFTTDVGAA